MAVKNPRAIRKNPMQAMDLDPKRLNKLPLIKDAMNKSTAKGNAASPEEKIE